jgi:hypothetical protein
MGVNVFLSLLAATFLIAVAVSAAIAAAFHPAISRILKRIFSDEIYHAWVRYLMFAVFVVGISSGVRIWDLEKYIDPGRLPDSGQGPLVLNADRWVLEVYRTIVGTMQGLAWLLLVFFIFAMLAYVMVRFSEARGGSDRKPGGTS